VDDDIAEIEEQPARVDRPFAVAGFQSFQLEGALDLVLDGADLAVTLA
jgi:hypothetical protein